MVATKCGWKSKKNISLFINSAVNYLQRQTVCSLSHITYGFISQVLCQLTPKTTRSRKILHIFNKTSKNKTKWITEPITHRTVSKIKLLRKNDFSSSSKIWVWGGNMTFSNAVPSLHREMHYTKVTSKATQKAFSEI